MMATARVNWIQPVCRRGWAQALAARFVTSHHRKPFNSCCSSRARPQHTCHRGQTTSSLGNQAFPFDWVFICDRIAKVFGFFTPCASRFVAQFRGHPSEPTGYHSRINAVGTPLMHARLTLSATAS